MHGSNLLANNPPDNGSLLLNLFHVQSDRKSEARKRCITADRCFPRNDTLSGFRRDSRKHTSLQELGGSMLLMSVMNHAMLVTIPAVFTVILSMHGLVYVSKILIKHD